MKLNDFHEHIRKRIEAQIQADDKLSDTKQRQCSKTLAGDNEGKTQSARPLHCRFEMRRKSLLDVDAKYASVKDLLDCLVFSGVIPGDKEGQISLEVSQSKVKKGEPEMITIEVFEITKLQPTE